MKSRFALTLMLVSVVACVASASRTDRGTWSAGGSLMVDVDTYVGTELEVELQLGQYIETGFMAGGYGLVINNDAFTSLSLGALGKYHFLDSGRSPFSPYVGGDIGVAYASTDDAYAVEDSSNFALVLGVRFGMNFFLTEHAAIDTYLGLRVATDDVFTDDDDTLLTNSDVVLRIGLAFFF